MSAATDFPKQHTRSNIAGVAKKYSPKRIRIRFPGKVFIECSVSKSVGKVDSNTYVFV